MKRIYRLISVFLVFSVAFICITPGFSSENNSIVPKDKISKDLSEVMEKSSPDELIKVWVWLTDIDMSEASRRIESTTGYTEDDIKNLYSDEDFAELAEMFCDDGSSDRGNCTAKDKSVLLKQAKEKNKEKREIVKAYKRERLQVYDSMYTEHNNSVIDSLDLDRDKISFICSLTPSLIIEMSSSDIKNLAKSNLVIGLLLCEDDYVEEKSYIDENVNTRSQYDSIVSEDQLKSMHADLAQDYGYTGEDVNILFIGGTGYISLTDPTDLTDIDMENPDTVENVYNNSSYPITDPVHQPGNHDQHTHFCTKLLRKYAPDAHIYLVNKDGFNNGGQYNDIIYALEEKSIDLICIAMEYSNPYCYSSCTDAIWFDALAKTYSLPLVASASNDVFPYYHYVSSPGTCYNSIAVGAYEAVYNNEEDRMYNFRYNPISGTALPTYKPDVVAAADSTSLSAPTVAGIISWALEMNSDLLLKPQAVKAIVLASCHRKALPALLENGIYDQQENMQEGLTIKQGAGILDAYRVMKASAERTYGIVQLTPSNTFFVGNIIHQFSPNHYGTVDYDDSLNVSISWYVCCSHFGNRPDENTSAISNVQDINLKVLDGSIEKANSERENSCKQTAYIDNAEQNHIYQIRLENVTFNSNLETVDVGYAWTERGRNELTSLGFQGYPVPGYSLHANALLHYNQNANTDELIFSWEKSSDGLNWETLYETDENYLVTSADFLKYIKCTVVPKKTSLLAKNSLSATTQTKVYIFGDVDTDGYPLVDDCILLQKYVTNVPTNISDEGIAAADVNLDGMVDIIDVTLINMYTNGIINALPYTQ